VSCFNQNKKVYPNSSIISDNRGYVYFVGGKRDDDIVADIYRLDLKSMLYEKIGNLQIARANSRLFYDTKLDEILIIGGNNNNVKAVKESERFNLVKRTSILCSNLKYPRTNFALALGQNSMGETRLFAIGGNDESGNYTRTIESIDTAMGVNSEWIREEVDLPNDLNKLEAK